jgi:hypothetical protein
LVDQEKKKKKKREREKKKSLQDFARIPRGIAKITVEGYF